MQEYKSLFSNEESASFYENEIYGEGSYSHYIWSLQRPILRKIIQEYQAQRGFPSDLKLLDFACGTGRITSAVEDLATVSHGVDISPAMVEIAKSKSLQSHFFVGDILTMSDPSLSGYDIVTAFRFFLNVEHEMRINVLRELRKKMKSNSSILIANIHGNSWSARHIAIAAKKIRKSLLAINVPGELLNEMSPREAQAMFEQGGFQVQSCYGFGIVPPTLYRTPLASVAKVIDRSISGRNPLTSLTIDLLYVCTPM